MRIPYKVEVAVDITVYAVDEEDAARQAEQILQMGPGVTKVEPKTVVREKDPILEELAE